MNNNYRHSININNSNRHNTNNRLRRAGRRHDPCGTPLRQTPAAVSRSSANSRHSADRKHSARSKHRADTSNTTTGSAEARLRESGPVVPARARGRVHLTGLCRPEVELARLTPVDGRVGRINLGAHARGHRLPALCLGTPRPGLSRRG